MRARLFGSLLITSFFLSGCMQTPNLNHPEQIKNPLRNYRLGNKLGDGYIEIRSFNWGYKKEGDRRPELSGIIDSEGNVVVEPTYRHIDPLPPFIVAWDGRGSWLLRPDGTKVIPDPYQDYEPPTEGIGRVTNDRGEVAFYNEKGEILGNLWFREARAMKDGMGWFSGDNFMRADGVPVYSSEFWHISDFYSGIALARAEKGAVYLDKSLKPVSEQYWIDAIPFTGELAAIKDHSGWHIINRNFEKLGLGPFAEVSISTEGFNRVANSDGQYNLISDKGEFLLDEWQEGLSAMQSGMAILRRGDKFNLIDRTGKLLSSTWFDDIYRIEEGVATVYMQSKGYNFVNSRGEFINEAWINYPEALPASIRAPHNLIAVTAPYSNTWRRDGVNRHYKLTESESFISLKFYNRLLVADLGAPYGEHSGYQIMNADGKLVSDETFDSAQNTEDGYLAVERRDGKENLMDTLKGDGSLVSQVWYDAISPFDPGAQCTFVRNEEKRNFMYRNGELLSDEWSEDAFTTYDSSTTERDLKVIKLGGHYIVMDENCSPIGDDSYSSVAYDPDLPFFCVERAEKLFTSSWHRLFFDGRTESVASRKECLQ